MDSPQSGRWLAAASAHLQPHWCGGWTASGVWQAHWVLVHVSALVTLVFLDGRPLSRHRGDAVHRWWCRAAPRWLSTRPLTPRARHRGRLALPWCHQPDDWGRWDAWHWAVTHHPPSRATAAAAA